MTMNYMHFVQLLQCAKGQERHSVYVKCQVILLLNVGGSCMKRDNSVL